MEEHIPSYKYVDEKLQEFFADWPGDQKDRVLTFDQAWVLMVRTWEDGFSTGRNTKPAIEEILSSRQPATRP